MKTLVKFSDSHIYPGEFIPENDFDEKDKVDSIESAIKVKTPSINLIELPELIKIEIALPGIQREDIIIEGGESCSTIKAHHQKKDTRRKEICKFKEFDYEEEFFRKVNLSGNADITFMYAEHRHGILSIYIPKNKQKNKSISYKSSFVVY